MGVFSIMRLLPVVLIVFVCSVRLPDAFGCLTIGEAVGVAVALGVTYYLLDDSYDSDECESELKTLSTSGDEWTIYCCTTYGVVQKTCGNNGVNCFEACSNVRGNIRSASSSNCLRYVFGDDPYAQAKEHCKQAEPNHTIAKRSDYACPNSPAVDARLCLRRVWNI